LTWTKASSEVSQRKTMSNTRDVVDEFNEDMDKAAERGRKKDLVSDYRLDTQVKKIERAKQRLEIMKNLDLGGCFDEEYLEQMDKAQDRRVESFQKRLPFINAVLTQMVNLVAQELIFCGAKSGRGKSTSVANIIAPLLSMKPRRKILVISNEEKAESILNRIICLFMGWNINRFKSFTKEQLETLKKYRREMVKYVHIIDPEFPRLKGAVFSIEGVQAILERALDGDYDVILYDYYQKSCKSEENHTATKVQVLTDLSEYLDGYVKRSTAPVVIMGQLKTEGKDRVEFEDRIKECKAIFQNCTQAVEMVTEKETLKTTFILRKDRWGELDNLRVDVGFNKGRYVEYTEEFRATAAHSKLVRASREESKETLKDAGK